MCIWICNKVFTYYTSDFSQRLNRIKIYHDFESVELHQIVDDKCTFQKRYKEQNKLIIMNNKQPYSKVQNKNKVHFLINVLYASIPVLLRV